jgi:hypothetical protein
MHLRRTRVEWWHEPCRWMKKKRRARTRSACVRACRLTMSRAIIRRRCTVRRAAGGSATSTPKMRSGIRARCPLEKRGARHRAPSIDPALKPFRFEPRHCNSGISLEGSSSHAETPLRVFGTLPGLINSALGRKAEIRLWLIPSQMKTLHPFELMAKISEQFRNNKGRTAGKTR